MTETSNPVPKTSMMRFRFERDNHETHRNHLLHDSFWNYLRDILEFGPPRYRRECKILVSLVERFSVWRISVLEMVASVKTLIRSRKHLAYIRSLPCLACKASAPSQAAHIRTGTNGGTGIKPGDNYTVPLCPTCHHKQHQIGEQSFWAEIFGHRCGIDVAAGYARFFGMMAQLICGQNIALTDTMRT